MSINVTEIRDCTLPAPTFYRSQDYNACLPRDQLSMYIITLVFLFKETSKAFQTYKYFIIVHIIINMISETFVSFLMLPITYLPNLLIRTTGILSNFGFSGIFQWYVLATLVMLTGGSICEMFYYRFEVSVFDYKKHKMYVILTVAKWAFRGIVVSHTLFAAFTVNTSIRMIQEETMKLWTKNPTMAPEITCYSTVMGILDDYINIVVAVIYVLALAIGITSAGSCLLYITIVLRYNNKLSKATIRMQTMFIFSLAVQAAVHGVMIAIPGALFVYARFSVLTFDKLALFMMVCLAYHGFFSLCGMILFTKPIKDKFLCKKRKPNEFLVSTSRVK